MTEQRACPSCGARLTAEEGPEGCARCLMQVGIATIVDPVEPESIPDRIGDYRVREILGEGGMGRVYLASQESPIRRNVALKVIKLGMDSRAVLARFEIERQALALMEHPQIAKVHDAGITERGQPYFVMEYVKGVPITDYCDQNRLGTKQRIELFMKVCEGVQHAHHKGVIHRDLKPTNILVGDVDGVPTPKIIDFGLAKATGTSLTDTLNQTLAGQVLGTPVYMSPEQAESRPDVDARTDIYSLGVLLYELLTGTKPIDLEQISRAAIGEIRRVISEVETPKPSQRLTVHSGAERQKIARSRSTTPEQLKRALKGDLDWILLKTLDKSPGRRYETPSAFAADLRRHLNHEPVAAGPPSAAYRARKFIRRHRIGVTVAAATAVLLVGFAVRERAQAQRIAREAATAEQVSDFLIGLFEVSDPSEARGNSITAREILDQGARKITQTLGGEPEVQARLMHTMGRVYHALGLFPQAEPLLQRALETRRTLLGDDERDTLLTMNDLAHLHHSQGRFEEAERLFLEAVEDSARALGADHRQTLAIRNNLASLHVNQGRYDDAETLYLETLETGKRALGNDHPDTLASMDGLAELYRLQGRFDEAEPLSVETLDTRTRVLGKDHPETLVTTNNLAVLYRDLGRYDEAEALYVEALEAQKRVLGDDHPLTLYSLANLGFLYKNQGRLDEAEPLYLEAFETRRRVLGDEHQATLTSMNNLAALYRDQGRYDEAEALHLQDLETCKRVLGEEHPDTLSSMNNLAVLYVIQSRYDEAEALHLKGLEIRERVLGPDHPGMMIAMNNLGYLYNQIGRYDDAEPVLAEALARARSALPREHLIPGVLSQTYGNSLKGLQRYDEAEASLLEAHEIVGTVVGEDHSRIHLIVSDLVALYEAWERPGAATEWRAKIPEDTAR